ncbi:hypothetical protein FHR99_000532 [Litorivivens lipolytica]|uniref:Uncharacterized protein n=1 Tax=Litorivivens lipolytica TaxID=1524264 RepID=A0A7W4W2M7_9GAMM|nr:hypothetical protein [Litorivivens lipolytica]MBB3046296.1 hypothetical protein [Litorivivens lipolytica]
MIRWFFCLALSVTPLAFAEKISIGDTRSIDLERVFLQLEAASGNTKRREISSLDAPVDPAVFTRLKRTKSNGRESYSNATLIAANHCYWIASTAGHSVLDHRFSRLTNRGDIAVQVPGGDWLNPVEIIASPDLEWSSDEIDDWALLVLRARRCEFDDSQHFPDILPHLPTRPLESSELADCRNQVQFMCYHFDQGKETGQRMLEDNCQLLSIEREQGRTGYASCKVDYGVSGCSPVCVLGEVWINLGVFSKGLMRHRSDSYPQPVAGFRIMDGEIMTALEGLKQKYGISRH